MAREGTFGQFMEEVAQAERIPCDREATTEELRSVDDLVARLKAAAQSGGPPYRYLCVKAKAVQARINSASGKEPAEPVASEPVPDNARQQPNTNGLKQLHGELSEMAAKLPLGAKALRRLEEIINDAGSRAARHPGYRRLYDRALEIQKKALRPPRVKSKRRRGGGGLVLSAELTEGGREVLGGLPSSRRGH